MARTGNCDGATSSIEDKVMNTAINRPRLDVTQALWSATLAACLVLLAACAATSQAELQSIGSQIYRETVDFSELQSYGKRAKAAYGTETQIRAAYPKTVRFAQPGQTEVVYFIERDDAVKTQTVTVRGTANHKNLSEDMDFKVRTDRKTQIPVHTGFDRDAQAVYRDAQAYLKPGYRTYVTGHSLGGAVAALLAIYAIEDGYKVEKVVTFGQPRFTTATGVSKLGFCTSWWPIFSCRRSGPTMSINQVSPRSRR